MSASEKKARRDEKRRQEEQKDRRSIALYSVVGIIVVVAAVIMLVWNSGLLQRNLTALNVNGTKYTAADLQYYYNSVYKSYANQYAFDSSVSVKKQKVGGEGSETWFNLLMDEARDSLISADALAARAREAGHTLSAGAQSERDSVVSQLDTTWVNYGSRDAMIKANFGPYMTYDRLIRLIDMEYLAADYAQAQLDAIEHPDADYEAYYKEHADELDTIVYSQLSFRAYVPTVDADGNTIEMTDAERTAQLETLKAEQKALAEEVKAKLEGGAKVEDIVETYQDQLSSSYLSQRIVGSSVSLYSSNADWLLDSARRAGDVTLTESDAGTAYYYYVAVYEGRLRDEEPANDVRHLLVRAGDGSATPTQAEYDEAEKKARGLLDEWKSGEATEDSFAALVTANTDDTSSASSGGLYSNITSASSYVQAFKDWACASAHRPGDTGLVKTEYGWHIMYYSAANDPVWKQTTATGLQNQDYETLIADVQEGRNASWGMGLNLIKP